MISAIKNMFRSNAAKQNEWLGLVGAAVERYPYAPYTRKFLENPLPIKHDTLPNREDCSAGMTYSVYDTRPTSLIISRRVNTATYSFAEAIEHESVHVDQRRIDFGFLNTLFLTPRAGLKLTRVQELEAYGQQQYKFLVEAHTKSLSEDAINEYLQNAGMLRPLMEAYIEMQLTFEQSIAAFKEIVTQKSIKAPEELLGGFFGQMSSYVRPMELMSQRAIENKYKETEFIKRQSPHRIGLLMEQNNNTPLFSRDITFNDASALLSRNGVDYFDKFTPEQKEGFWQNICYTSKQEELQLQHVEKRISGLGL